MIFFCVPKNKALLQHCFFYDWKLTRDDSQTRIINALFIFINIQTAALDHVIIKHWSLFIAREETYLIIFYVVIFHTSVLLLYNNAYIHLGDGGRDMSDDPDKAELP